MSASCCLIDREKGVAWIVYQGVADELYANLRSYGVDFIPSLYSGRVGITFRRALNDAALEVLSGSAATVVELMTVRRGVTKRDEREFYTALVVVQSCQRVEKHESVQARDLADWVKTMKVGGAA